MVRDAVSLVDLFVQYRLLQAVIADRLARVLELLRLEYDLLGIRVEDLIEDGHLLMVDLYVAPGPPHWFGRRATVTIAMSMLDNGDEVVLAAFVKSRPLQYYAPEDN